MKKINCIFLVCINLFSFYGKTFGQSFTYSSSATIMVGVPGDTFQWNLTLSNPTGSNITVYMNRYQKSNPPYWYSCFCYIQCNPPSLDNLTINIGAGSSTMVTVLFKTDSVNPGIATSSLRFYQSGFTNNADTVHLSATTQLATGIDDPQLFNSFVSYPNPVQDKLIFTPALNESYSLSVTDINGRLIRQFKELTDQKYSLNLQDFPNGEYFLKATYNSGKTETKKIIKN